MEYDLIKGVAMRFLRGAVSGALSTMAVVVTSVAYVQGITTWADIKNLGYSLILACIIGVLTGGIQAADKFYRSV